MKIIIMAYLILSSTLASCSTTPAIILRFEDRPYRPCTVKELEKFRPDHDGRISFCFRYCAKYKLWHRHISKNCKLWKTDILENQSRLKQLRPHNFVW